MAERNGQNGGKKGKPGGGGRAFIQQFLDDSVQRVMERPSLAGQAWHVVLMVAVGVRRAQIPRMAAALSYRTIFGLIPVLVVSFVFLTAFSTPEAMKDRVHQVLDYAGITKLTITERAVDEGLFFEAADATPLDQWIESLVTRVRTLPPEALSVIGIATLIYAAISMLIEIELAFNQIYMAPGGRSWVRRVVQYWALLTLGTMGLVGTFAAQQYALNFVENLHLAYLSGAKKVLVGAMQVALPALVSTALLMFVYMTVPNTRVRPVPAAVGAVMAAVLWETGKFGIRLYAANSVSYSTLYGPLALLPLFLLWVYVTWLIVLSGLQVAHALQAYGTAREQGLTRSVLGTLGLLGERAQRGALVVDPAAAVVVMAEAGKRFRAGRASTHGTIHDSTGVDERVVSEMLERLAGAGLLHRISGGEDEGSYTLARPPEAISAAEVLRVGEELSAIDRERAPALLRDLGEARLRGLGGRTLADLMGPAEKPVEAAAPALTGPAPAGT